MHTKSRGCFTLCHHLTWLSYFFASLGLFFSWPLLVQLHLVPQKSKLICLRIFNSNQSNVGVKKNNNKKDYKRTTWSKHPIHGERKGHLDSKVLVIFKEDIYWYWNNNKNGEIHLDVLSNVLYARTPSHFFLRERI